MSEKIAKTICRYATERGHSQLRLEKKGADLLCIFGHNNPAAYLRLDANEEMNIAATFRSLAGAAENDLFTDKRFKIYDNGQVISGRATLLPAGEGEKLLISLSSKKPQIRRLSALGFSREEQQLLKENLRKKSGLIIIAAAEENGATSTYYSLLKLAAVNHSTYSLETYPLPLSDNISTINLNNYEETAEAIDKILHLDSEIIGIDTVLRKKDIQALWRAARSGRLIIMTLPAKNAAQVLKILKQAGLKAADIASQTKLIIAQKLFSRPCSHCLKKFDAGQDLKKIIIKRWPLVIQAWPKRLYTDYGCTHCQPNKNNKQTAVFEVMRFLNDGRLAKGYQPLIIDALAKAEQGLIKIEDIATWAQTDKKYESSLRHSRL